MLTLRESNDRGSASLGWLESKHSFSFGSYHDPNHMGFGALRVINEDWIDPGAGFDTHGHRDMEIVSYVLDGALEHKDSIGSGSVMRPGDVQRMSAGTGIRHSEFNHSQHDPVHLLQIWIEPERAGLTPGYEEKSFAADRRGRLCLLASRDGRDGALTIHQDVDIFATQLEASAEVQYEVRPGRKVWVQVARGAADINGEQLGEGDGAALEGEPKLKLKARTDAEILLFDMA